MSKPGVAKRGGREFSPPPAVRLPKVKPFDPAATCAKCGHDHVMSDFRRSTHLCYRSDKDLPCEGLRQPECCEFEHIHRWCRRCRFEWLEAPLDG